MRIGLVGFGAWGRLHAAAIARLPGLALAGIACGSAQSAAAAAAAHPGVPVHADLAGLLADRSVELVDIAAPNHLHAGMAVAALDAGRHVLLEKPLATSIADGARVVAAAKRSGRFLAIGHELRVSHQWRTVKALLAETGAPYFANVALFRRPFRAGAKGWRYDPARVGSWILEEPVHYLDLLLWYFAEAGPPLAVEAWAAGPSPGPGMNPAFACRIEFPGRRFGGFAQCLGGFQHHLTVELACERGAIRSWWSGAMDRTLTPRFELSVRRGEGEAETVALPASGEVFELEEQLRTLPARVAAMDPIVSAEAGFQAVRLCLAAERALATGRTVPLD